MIGGIVLAAATWAGICAEAGRDLAAGTALSSSNVVAVPCRDERAAALRYDRRARILVTRQALPAGAYLGHVGALSDLQTATGATLVLRSTVGPVTIEREVTALQPGRAGKRVFVRDANGRVFAAPLAPATSK
jgi:hypothetical protein